MKCLLPGKRKPHLWRDSRISYTVFEPGYSRPWTGSLYMDLKKEKCQIKRKSHNVGLDRFSQEWPWVLKFIRASVLRSCVTVIRLIWSRTAHGKNTRARHHKSAGLTECGISLTFYKLAADTTVPLCALIRIQMLHVHLFFHCYVNIWEGLVPGLLETVWQHHFWVIFVF